MFELIFPSLKLNSFSLNSFFDKGINNDKITIKTVIAERKAITLMKKLKKYAFSVFLNIILIILKYEKKYLLLNSFFK